MKTRKTDSIFTPAEVYYDTSPPHPQARNTPSFGKIFRPADDEAAQLYFVYSKPTRRWQGGKDAERKF